MLPTHSHCLLTDCLENLESFQFFKIIRIGLTVICVRGTFIVPSFDEIWPQPGKERAGKARTRMGYDYILEAMQVALDV